MRSLNFFLDDEFLEFVDALIEKSFFLGDLSAYEHAQQQKEPVIEVAEYPFDQREQNEC